VRKYLDAPNLDQWFDQYPERTGKPKNIGLIMAGNLPLVGLHDLICVFASGHNATVKLSSQDIVLIPLLCNIMISKNFEIQSKIVFVEDLDDSRIDGLIATGSDNTSRYIKYKFSEIPQIIRSNRSSVAILTGNETSQQLSKLGDDMLIYFGRGCRNVSKVYVPEQYRFDEFINSNRRFNSLNRHSKYFNNYLYQKALFSTREIDFIDTGYLLITRHHSVVAPLSVVYFETYKDTEHLNYLITQNSQKTQCIASAEQWYQGSYDFGSLQFPDLWDYADNIDTMQFLLDI
jgi:hypothetical protein